jgi:Glucan phosphorylase
VAQRKARGYRPRDVYESNPELREALDAIGSGLFSNGDRDLFQPLVHSLLEHDDYMLLADYQGYLDAQGAGERRLGRSTGVDAHVDPELRESRPLLLRSIDQGLLPADLEHSSVRSGAKRWPAVLIAPRRQTPLATTAARPTPSRRDEVLRSAPRSVAEGSTSACSPGAPS